MNWVKIGIGNLFQAFGFSILKTTALRNYETLKRSWVLLQILSASAPTENLTLKQAGGIIGKAKSQLGQDVLALSQVGIGKSGFFVEFGATNGVELSNTFLLESEFGWTGILCEPAKRWHENLNLNRSCIVDTRCVYPSTGKMIMFTETAVGEFSTITSFLNSENSRLKRKHATHYEVETVTLGDLLATHKAPRYIDFLSIDTEGSEYEILKEFDFSEYSFGLICVEHNFTDNREKVEELLVRNGYSKVFPEFSAWDDWYLATNK